MSSTSYRLRPLLMVIASGAAILWSLQTITKARRSFGQHAASSSVASNVRRAIQNYHTTYRHYPVSDGIDRAETSGELIDILQGHNLRGLNAEQSVFLTVPKSVSGSAGLLGIGSPYFLIDSWGNPFHVEMDTDGDGMVPDPEHPGTHLYLDVVVWSAGDDGNLATWSDNVRSW